MKIYLNNIPDLILALSNYISWLKDPNYGNLTMDDIDIDMLEAALEVVWMYQELQD